MGSRGHFRALLLIDFDPLCWLLFLRHVGCRWNYEWRLSVILRVLRVVQRRNKKRISRLSSKNLSLPVTLPNNINKLFLYDYKSVQYCESIANDHLTNQQSSKYPAVNKAWRRHHLRCDRERNVTRLIICNYCRPLTVIKSLKLNSWRLSVDLTTVLLYCHGKIFIPNRLFETFSNIYRIHNMWYDMNYFY